ncbi:hypothetical protein X975_00642, partial [Stegodyphus mimosarum]
MNFEKKRSCRITSRQLETLVTFMEKHPEFSSGKLTPEMNKSTRKEMWEQLALQLNYDGWGPIKTADQWRKVCMTLLTNCMLLITLVLNKYQ